MYVSLLKAKLHRACVTDANVAYEGSFGIDIELMEAVGLHPYEKVLVANLNGGARFETYAIPEPFGSRYMVANGAAAHLVSPGDRVIIMAFCQVEESVARDGKHRPRILRLNEHNEPITNLSRTPTTEEIASMLEG